MNQEAHDLIWRHNFDQENIEPGTYDHVPQGAEEAGKILEQFQELVKTLPTVTKVELLRTEIGAGDPDVVEVCVHGDTTNIDFVNGWIEAINTFQDKHRVLFEELHEDEFYCASLDYDV